MRPNHGMGCVSHGTAAVPQLRTDFIFGGLGLHDNPTPSSHPNFSQASRLDCSTSHDPHVDPVRSIPCHAQANQPTSPGALGRTNQISGLPPPTTVIRPQLDCPEFKVHGLSRQASGPKETSSCFSSSFFFPHNSQHSKLKSLSRCISKLPLHRDFWTWDQTPFVVISSFIILVILSKPSNLNSIKDIAWASRPPPRPLPRVSIMDIPTGRKQPQIDHTSSLQWEQSFNHWERPTSLYLHFSTGKHIMQLAGPLDGSIGRHPVSNIGPCASPVQETMLLALGAEGRSPRNRPVEVLPNGTYGNAIGGSSYGGGPPSILMAQQNERRSPYGQRLSDGHQIIRGDSATGRIDSAETTKLRDLDRPTLSSRMDFANKENQAFNIMGLPMENSGKDFFYEVLGQESNKQEPYGLDHKTPRQTPRPCVEVCFSFPD